MPYTNSVTGISKLPKKILILVELTVYFQGLYCIPKKTLQIVYKTRYFRSLELLTGIKCNPTWINHHMPSLKFGNKYVTLYPTHSDPWNYLSMMGLKLIHVNKDPLPFPPHTPTKYFHGVFKHLSAEIKATQDCNLCTNFIINSCKYTKQIKIFLFSCQSSNKIINYVICRKRFVVRSE